MSGFGNRYISGLRWSLGRLFIEGGWCGLVPIGVSWDPITFEPIEDISAGEISIPEPTQEVLNTIPGAFDWVNIANLEKELDRSYISGMDSIALPQRLLSWYADEPPEGITQLQKDMGNKTLWAHWYFYVHPSGDGFSMENPFRPSALSGKLKLLFQSVLAKKEPTQYIIKSYGTPTLSNSGFGLFTTSTYKYYLIRIREGTVSAAPIVLNSTLSRYIRNYLIDNPSLPRNIHKRIEACLLSTYDGFDAEQEIELLTLPEMPGDTIQYGWHFSWMGRQASIVLHSTGNISETWFELVANRYSLNFAEIESFDPSRPMSADNCPISCSLTVDEEDVIWYPLDTDLIWKPESLGKCRTGNMEVVSPIRSTQWGKMTDPSGAGWEGGVNPVYGTEYDAPLYSFYEHSCCVGSGLFSMDEDSNLRVLRYQKTILPSISVHALVQTKLGLAINSYFSPVCWPGGSTQSYGSDEIVDPERVEGFYVADAENNPIIDQRRDVYCVIDAAKLNLYGEPNGNTTSVFWQYLVLQSGWGANGANGDGYAGGNGYAYKYCEASTYKTGTGFAIIPYFSSEAVYMGKNQRTNVPGEYRSYIENTFSMIAHISDGGTPVLYNTLYPDLRTASCGGGVSDCSFSTSTEYIAKVTQEFTVKLTTAFHENINIPITEEGKIMEEDEITASGGTTPRMTLGTWDWVYDNPGVDRITTRFIFNTYGGVDTAMFYTADISEAKTEDTCIATQGLPQEYADMFYGYFFGSS